VTEVREGTLAGGLPFLALGTGPPLVVFSGWTPAHANPTGIGRWLEAKTLGPDGRAVQRRLADGPERGDLRGAYRELGTTMARSRLARVASGACFWLLGPMLMGASRAVADGVVTLRAEDTFDVSRATCWRSSGSRPERPRLLFRPPGAT
jgi:hypothetical protein